jgi:uncharacterized protein YkwD
MPSWPAPRRCLPPARLSALTLGRVLALGLALAAGVSGVGLAPLPVAAQSPHDRAFLDLINEARTSRGLDPLRFDSRAQRWAEGWTLRMVEGGEPFHQDLQVFVGGSIVRVGENVGVSTEGVGAVFRGFMASPGHRANILDPSFTHVGIGTVRAPYRRHDATWTTFLFLRVRR